MSNFTLGATGTEPTFLTRAELAEAFGISANHLAVNSCKGKAPPHTFRNHNGRSIAAYSVEDTRAWLKANQPFKLPAFNAWIAARMEG